MFTKKTIKDKLKKIITSLLISGILANPFAKIAKAGSDETIMSARTMVFDLNHPLATAESRANATYSVNQLTNKLLNKNTNDDFIERTTKTFGEAYISFLTAYVSHEAGHEEKNLKFSGNLRKRTLTPKIEQSMNISKENLLNYSVRGLNQNQLNSKTIWENGQLNPKNFDDTGFLMNSLYTSFYNLDSETRDSSITSDDLESYIQELKKRGIKTSEKEIKNKSLIANALTFQNYQSIFNIANYLINGETDKKHLILNVHDLNITLPMVNYYLTEKKGFYNITSVLNPDDKNPISLSFGIGEDSFFRFGGKVYDVKTRLNTLKISPYGYLTPKSGTYSIGFNTKYDLKDNFSIIARTEVNHKDILENLVKEKSEGFNLKFELEIRF